MSPRGRATPDVRGLLFDAAERVVLRSGPAGLTSRAVTTEAGCAKGLLHAHFGGLDEFVAELCLDRIDGVAARASALADRAGQGEVAENLHTALDVLLGSTGPALAAAAMTRAGSARRVREAMASGDRGFAVIQDALARYLAAELRLGRVPAGTDPQAAALALVGTAHHLLMTAPPGEPAAAGGLWAVVALILG
ncbi:TetR/AcrR family transcriptional regulator [Phaeacidiphilus oryzae]|uniref:TetR/AcrR family transcriptional regulator n=1 Tax=Phaeacidiphilus oryzae TaxID=348818 RepID=UPI00055F8847|nr:TetR/AcrR family transcriptional regulator [Phaeacidiphilus oryzae]